MDEFSIYKTQSGGKLEDIMNNTDKKEEKEEEDNPNKERIERLKTKIKTLQLELERLESLK